MAMRNLKLILSYDGTDFNGWQTQPGYRTVQSEIEAAIFKVTGSQVFANASGRTDAGVHALGQVVNFWCPTRLTPAVLVRALNAHLPDDIAVSHCSEVVQSFDASKDAERKLYRYVINDSLVRSPFMYRFATPSRHRLDTQAMSQGAHALVGRHDFHSFETDWPNRLSSIRTVTHLSINRVGEHIWIDIEADGFLYNMVRSIAGTLMNVGRGFWPASKVAEILHAENRTQAGPTAPPMGLFLIRVTYPPAIEKKNE